MTKVINFSHVLFLMSNWMELWTCLGIPPSGVSPGWSGETALGKRYILSAARWQPSPPPGSYSTGSCLSHTYMDTEKQWFIRQRRGINNICGIDNMVIQVCGHCRGGNSLGIGKDLLRQILTSRRTAHNQVIFTSVHTVSQKCLRKICWWWSRKWFLGYW